MATAKPRDPRMSHDRRILLMSLASALPGALISLIFLWTGDITPKVQWTLSVIIIAFCLGFAFALRERVVLPLQTLSNLLAALGEGDFSIRARGARGGDPLGEVMVEVNTLVETLRHQRLDALEATTLLRKVMAEIEVAVFTFDGERGCSRSPPNGRWGGTPTTSASRTAWKERRRASSTRRSPAAWDGGRSVAAPSAREDGRTSSSSCPT
jgi:HAMP domain-containing protein